MKVHPIITLWLASSLAMLTGCATYPISKDLREQSHPVTLRQVRDNPAAARGKSVIWGGRIIKTVNDTNGASLYVLALPLNHFEKPRTSVNSTGRFIARSTDFLDPQVLKQGKLVTIAGTVSDVEPHKVQKAQYQYPVLDIQQVHVWPRVRKHYWGVGWGWYYPDDDWGYYSGWGPEWGWHRYYSDPDDWDRR